MPAILHVDQDVISIMAPSIVGKIPLDKHAFAKAFACASIEQIADTVTAAFAAADGACGSFHAERELRTHMATRLAGMRTSALWESISNEAAQLAAAEDKRHD